MAKDNRKVVAMNVLFFTPTLVNSAIGRVSCMVVNDLVRLGNNVTVISTQAEALISEPSHEFNCKVLFWNEYDKIWPLVDNVDVVSYQIGDNYQYHKGCIEWLPSLPGVVSLHDNFLGHLFWAYADKIGRADAYKILFKYYKKDIVEAYFNHADSESFIAATADNAPMIEWVVSMASAVIVHSNWALPRIIKFCRGPVSVLSLPYDAPYLTVDEVKKLKKHIKINKKKHIKNNSQVTVLTIGNVNPNKRYNSIIQAIAASKLLRETIAFRIVGSVEETMSSALRQLAEKQGVSVSIIGKVDDKTLAREIQDANVMCCLRWPALESASASTIESMLYGKAILVTDTGFYQDLPDSCVLKVRPENEITDITNHLESLVLNQKRILELGLDAKRYAKDTFSSNKYAMGILQIKGLILRSNLIQNESNKILNILFRWGASGNAEIINTISSPQEIIK